MYRSFITEYGVSFYNFYHTVPQLYLNKDCNLKELISDYMKFMGVELSNNNHEELVDKNFELYTGIIQHRWDLDPLSRGSYSGYSISLAEQLDNYVNVHGYKFKKIYEPKAGLVIAGEHATSLECIGTMEAAVESGQRAAQYLISLLDPNAYACDNNYAA